MSSILAAGAKHAQRRAFFGTRSRTNSPPQAKRSGIGFASSAQSIRPLARRWQAERYSPRAKLLVAIIHKAIYFCRIGKRSASSAKAPMKPGYPYFIGACFLSLRQYGLLVVTNRVEPACVACNACACAKFVPDVANREEFHLLLQHHQLGELLTILKLPQLVVG